ncbi:hypothetical protein GCM10011317_37480 [Niveispirillum cyanobacteriorum]|nr:hypothetical protein GCM10011317_37480 [Niveispirillum cyanobacteriorum]
MRRLLAGFLMVALLLTGGATADQAVVAKPEFDVLIDNSGSMDGFRFSLPWKVFLSGLEKTSGRRFVFDENLRRANFDLKSLPLDAQITDLGQAIKSWMDIAKPGQSAIIVTDNVADSRNTRSSSSQLEWERELQSGSVAHLVLVPLRLPFNGRIYSPVDGGAADYQGQRALAVYLLVKAADDNATVRDSVLALEASARSILQNLRAEPGRGVEHVWLPITPFDIAGSTSQVILDLVKQERATVRLLTDTDSKTRLEIRDFGVGDTIAFGFDATVRPGENFVLKDAQVDARLSLDGHTKLVNEGLIKAEVTPRQSDLGPEGRKFRIDFSVQPFHVIDLSYPDMLQLAMANETTVKGKLNIRYSVERNKLWLVDGLSVGWSYDGPPGDLRQPERAIQSRIYRLTELVRGSVRTDALTQDALTIDVEMHVRYPLRPLLLGIVLGALALAGAVWVLLQLSRPRAFLGRNDANQEQLLAPSLFSPAYMLSSDQRCSITARWLPVGILVSANGQLRTGRLLPSGGGAIEVSVPADDAALPSFYSFFLEPVSDPTSEDDDGFY